MTKKENFDEKIVLIYNFLIKGSLAVVFGIYAFANINCMG